MRYPLPAAVVLGKILIIFAFYSGYFLRTKADANAPTGDTPPIPFPIFQDKQISQQTPGVHKNAFLLFKEEVSGAASSLM
ncbi:hypothetical protein GGC63_003619 [Paenibacillus sp. OAS669]|nr:hypothetical protein [Paenibacillus sp. OAS669]